MNQTTTTPLAPAEIAEHLQRCLPQLLLDWNPDLRLADLHLDSLDTVAFLCAVHEEFGVRLTDAEFHPTQTLGGLLAAISARARA